MTFSTRLLMQSYNPFKGNLFQNCWRFIGINGHIFWTIPSRLADATPGDPNGYINGNEALDFYHINSKFLLHKLS